MNLLSRKPMALTGCYKANWAYPGEYDSTTLKKGYTFSGVAKNS